MSDIWDRIRSLTGQTIPLLNKDDAFDIESADDRHVYVLPHSTGNKRTLYRISFERAEEGGLASGDATPSEIGAAVVGGRKITDRQSSYIAAILRYLARNA